MVERNFKEEHEKLLKDQEVAIEKFTLEEKQIKNDLIAQGIPEDAVHALLASMKGHYAPFIYRAIEDLSEAEKQGLLDATAKTKADKARSFTEYAYRKNRGLIPTHDELSQGFAQDYDGTTYSQMANSHGFAMGKHYSLLGIARRETPLFLPFELIGDVWGGIKGNIDKKIKPEDFLKMWDTDYKVGKKAIEDKKYGGQPAGEGFDYRQWFEYLGKVKSNVRKLSDHYSGLIAECKDPETRKQLLYQFDTVRKAYLSLPITALKPYAASDNPSELNPHIEKALAKLVDYKPAADKYDITDSLTLSLRKPR